MKFPNLSSWPFYFQINHRSTATTKHPRQLISASKSCMKNSNKYFKHAAIKHFWAKLKKGTNLFCVMQRRQQKWKSIIAKMGLWVKYDTMKHSERVFKNNKHSSFLSLRTRTNACRDEVPANNLLALFCISSTIVTDLNCLRNDIPWCLRFAWKPAVIARWPCISACSLLW